MLILEDLKEINDVIKELAEFIQNDEFVKPDFEEYISQWYEFAVCVL